MLSYLTIAIVAVSNKRPFGANSNTEGPAFKGADSRSRGTIWGTSEAHYCTTIHSNRVISAHAHYNLGQAEAKGEAILIDSDVPGRARVKFVYHMTFQNDSYKLRMAWFLDLVWTGRILSISNLLSVCTLYTSFSVESVFCLAYFCLIIIETSFPYEHMPVLNKPTMSQILFILVSGT